MIINQKLLTIRFY